MDGTECQVHKNCPPKWALSSEHSIGLTFSLKEDEMRSIWTWFELDRNASVLHGLKVLQTMKVDTEVAHDKHRFSSPKNIIFYHGMITGY